MHIYYFFKDSVCYVMDSNHKLYRYRKSNNIEFILETENLITEFIQAYNEDPQIYELTLQDIENIKRFILGLSTVEYHYLNELAFIPILLQLTILIKQNYFYSTRKRNAKNETKIYERILENTIEELKAQLENLKQISFYQKEEVSLAYLDPNIPKVFLKDTQEIAKSYYENIDLELEANISTYDFFNDPRLEEPKNFSSKGDRKWLNKKQKIINILKRQIPIEVEERIKYDALKHDQNLVIENLINAISLPIIAEIIKKTTRSEIPNIIYDIVEIISIFYIANRLHFLKLINTELEKTNAPLLILHKKQKEEK